MKNIQGRARTAPLSRQISFAVPVWIAPIVRTALEARAKEFESATTDMVVRTRTHHEPGQDTSGTANAWLSKAKELRRLASLLPHTDGKTK